jgi:hypothetical protein
VADEDDNRSPRGGRDEEDDGSDGSGDGARGGSDDGDPRLSGDPSDFGSDARSSCPGGPDGPSGADDAAVWPLHSNDHSYADLTVYAHYRWRNLGRQGVRCARGLLSVDT